MQNSKKFSKKQCITSGEIRVTKYSCDQSCSVCTTCKSVRSGAVLHDESYLVLLAPEIVQRFANQSAPNTLRVAVLHLPQIDKESSVVAVASGNI